MRPPVDSENGVSSAQLCTWPPGKAPFSKIFRGFIMTFENMLMFREWKLFLKENSCKGNVNKMSTSLEAGLILQLTARRVTAGILLLAVGNIIVFTNTHLTSFIKTV